jgi:hypothetical protein
MNAYVSCPLSTQSTDSRHLNFHSNRRTLSMTPEEEAEWFAKNARAFPDGWYPDDDEFSSDLIALVVTDDVPVEVRYNNIPDSNL